MHNLTLLYIQNVLIIHTRAILITFNVTAKTNPKMSGKSSSYMFYQIFKLVHFYVEIKLEKNINEHNLFSSSSFHNKPDIVGQILSCIAATFL